MSPLPLALAERLAMAEPEEPVEHHLSGEPERQEERPV